MLTSLTPLNFDFPRQKKGADVYQEGLNGADTRVVSDISPLPRGTTRSMWDYQEHLMAP